MKLLLHIGMPKTGSTALQAAFTNYRALLLRHGVLYPEVGFDPSNHCFLDGFMRPPKLLTNRTLTTLLGGKDPDYTAKVLETNWIQIKQQINKHNPHTVILSGETMFRGFETGNSGTFKSRLLDLTDDIQVVTYIRQPSKRYLSDVQERLKRSSSFPPPAAASIRKTLEICEALFGRKPKVMMYERDLHLAGDITSDFLGRLLPELGPVIPQVSSPVLNKSLSAESMAILQDYREAIYPDADNLFMEDSSRLRWLLQRTEKNHDLFRRPVLFAEIGHFIDNASIDLLWLEKNYDIRFGGIDYSAIKESTDNPYRSFSKVSDICVVDVARKQRILMLVTHAQLSQQMRTLSYRLRIWSYKYKYHASSRILQRTHAGLRWLRATFSR